MELSLNIEKQKNRRDAPVFLFWCQCCFCCLYLDRDGEDVGEQE